MKGSESAMTAMRDFAESLGCKPKTRESSSVRSRKRLLSCFREIEEILSALRLETEAAKHLERCAAQQALASHLAATAALAALVYRETGGGRRETSALFGRPELARHGLMSDFVVTATEVRRRVAPNFQVEQPSLPDKKPGDHAALKQITPREKDVLNQLLKGHSNKIIAFKLDIRETTVKAHVTNLLRKLGCHSRMQATALFRRNA